MIYVDEVAVRVGGEGDLKLTHLAMQMHLLLGSLRQRHYELVAEPADDRRCLGFVLNPPFQSGTIAHHDVWDADMEVVEICQLEGALSDAVIPVVILERKGAHVNDPALRQDVIVLPEGYHQDGRGDINMEPILLLDLDDLRDVDALLEILKSFVSLLPEILLEVLDLQKAHKFVDRD